MYKTLEKWAVDPCLSEVGLRYQASADLSSNPKLRSPEEVHEYLLALWNLDSIEISETFYVLLFNSKRRVLGWSKISAGSKTSTIVDVSHIATLALLGNATNVIVAHNHPSGEHKPSRADISITGKIVEALQLHDITLDDHLIITRNDFYSFLQNGLIHPESKTHER